MYKYLSFLLLFALIYHGEAKGERITLLNETFTNVSGNSDGTSELKTSQLDNPTGWNFSNAYAGNGFVIIKAGGSVTLPAIPNLVGNATFFFSTGPWEDPNDPIIEWENLKPHKLSLSGAGELNTTELDEMISMGAYYIFDGGADTRLTLTADHDITLSSIYVAYAGEERAKRGDNNLTGFSVPAGEYYNPFDLSLNLYEGSYKTFSDDGAHNIYVYTLNGTEPTRNSTRYNGVPIHIASNTILQTATIFGDGYMFIDTPQTYTFPTSSEYRPEKIYEVENTPGSLKNLLLSLDADQIIGLKITGKINGVDLAYLNKSEGLMASLAYLDLSEVTFDYDDTCYKVVVDAPEAGMGTVYTYYYLFSEENREERLKGSPTNENQNRYRNNLAASFYCHPTLRTVILPEFMSEIGERAFADCQELKTVKFPKEIKAIGDNAFMGKIELLDFPASIEKIGNSAFAGATLGNLTLGKKVELGHSAFSRCTVEKVEIPFPSDSIPNNTFYECNGLKEIVIGEGLRYLGENAFALNAITNAQLPQSIEEMYLSTFEDCPFVKNITPENGIRYIGRVAYQVTDPNLPEYTVKDGTISLCDVLFQNTQATVFNIPESVEIVGMYAFANTQITRVPDMPGVKRIGNYAFHYCPKLTKGVVPETVEYMYAPFQGCDSMWSLTYNAIDAECEGGLAPRALEEIIIGEKVKRIPTGLFSYHPDITEVNLPASVEEIDEYAFGYCPNLKSVNSTGKITSLGEHAFEGCTALEYVPALDVKDIPYCTFRDCNSLKEVSLSDRTETIGYMAFGYCNSLEDIHWPLSLKRISDFAFSNCSKFRVISLPEGTETVRSPFSGCTSINKIYIPSTLILESEDEDLVSNLTLYMEEGEATVTCMLQTPPDLKKWGWAKLKSIARIKVPAEYLEAYKTAPTWEFYTDLLEPIGELKTDGKESTTDFSSAVNEETDLTDTMMDNLYLTLGEEDGYDSSEGAIVINSTMDEEYVDEIGGMDPGKSDLGNRFNGIVLQIPAGNGSVIVNCMTIGSKCLSVKIGDEEPTRHTMSSKGEIEVIYDVDKDTYVYIYASDTESLSRAARRLKKAVSSENCVKLYSINVKPKNTAIEGIENVETDMSADAQYFTIDGVRIERPTEKGIYLVRHSDGTTSKILIK